MNGVPSSSLTQPITSVCVTGRGGHMRWALGRKSWRPTGGAGPDSAVGWRAGSFAEGCQPANAVPEGGRLPLGLCQYQDLLLGQAGGQCRVLLACQVVGPAEGWAEESRVHRCLGSQVAQGRVGSLCSVEGWNGACSCGREPPSYGAHHTQWPGPPSSLQRSCGALELLHGTGSMSGA